MAEENTPTLTLETVTAVEPDQLTEEQKTFLEASKDQLTDEQAEKYGITKEIKSEDIKPESRGMVAPTAPKKEVEEEKEDEEVLPEDKKVISKVVSEALSPIQKQLQEQMDQAELNNFVADNPEFAKYKQSISVYMKHEAYRNIPVKNIASIVAAKDLEKIGAQKEREAQKKALETQGGGSSARQPAGGAKDWRTASKEEVEAKRAEVLGQNRG